MKKSDFNEFRGKLFGDSFRRELQQRLKEEGISYQKPSKRERRRRKKMFEKMEKNGAKKIQRMNAYFAAEKKK